MTLSLEKITELYNKHAKYQEEGMEISGWIAFAQECYELAQTNKHYRTLLANWEGRTSYICNHCGFETLFQNIIVTHECHSRNAEQPLRCEVINWQPIETAPKDGRTIVVCYGMQSNIPVKVVHFNNIHKFWSHYGEADLSLETNATHWMPLPPPPEQP